MKFASSPSLTYQASFSTELVLTEGLDRIISRDNAERGRDLLIAVASAHRLQQRDSDSTYEHGYLVAPWRYPHSNDHAANNDSSCTVSTS